jgi:ribosomal protein L16 Arg81 hydroxylase
MTRSGRSHTSWDFANLVVPIKPSVFVRDYFGRRCLHVARSVPGHYADLLDRASLECFLVDTTFYKITSVQTPTPGEMFSVAPPRSADDVHVRLQAGASLRVRHLERWLGPHSPAVCLGRRMEMALGTTLDSLTCYHAPTNATGLGPHHDESEIFTLQIEGQKQWKFFGKGDAATAARYASTTLPPPIHDLVLEPGDLLYMPPGFIHDVRPIADSLSLAMVFNPSSAIAASA